MSRAAGLFLTMACASSAIAGDDAWLSSQVAAPEMRDEQRLLPRRAAAAQTADKPESPDAGESWGGSWLRSTLALAAVLGIIGVIALGSRRWVAPRVGARPGLIHVLGRVPIAGKQSLLLVRVGPQAVLIGMSHDRMTPLSVFDDPNVVASLAGQAVGGEERFREKLAIEQMEYEASDPTEAPPESSECGPTAVGRLSQLRRRLNGTLEKLGAGPPA